jgi:hypothetical protein
MADSKKEIEVDVKKMVKDIDEKELKNPKILRVMKGNPKISRVTKKMENLLVII